jgi:hypothetical protein
VSENPGTKTNSLNWIMENETETIAHAEPQHLLMTRIIDLSKANLINIFHYCYSATLPMILFTQLAKQHK